MIVEWRELPGCSSYEVSTDGRIRRKFVPRTQWTPHIKTWPGRHLKISDDYHPVVTLYYDGRTRRRKLAELVLLTFVGEPPSQHSFPIHEDGNTRNNRLANLRWSHPDKDGVMGATQGKLTQSDVDEIRAARAGPNPPTLAKLAEIYGVSLKQIYRIVHRRSWK